LQENCVTIGSKKYQRPEELAQEKDSTQINLIKKEILEIKTDSLLQVWLSEIYKVNFDLQQPANQFLVLNLLPYLTFKELNGIQWKNAALSALHTFIEQYPGRSDFFETYATQGLPLNDNLGPNVQNKSPIDFIVSNFDSISAKHGEDTVFNLIRLLVKLGANVNAVSGTPSNKYKVGNDKLVKLLLDLGACDIEMSSTFIRIPGGTFLMGNENSNENEKPVHQVTISSFSMAKYPVTQKEWLEVMGNNPSNFKRDTLPVVQVSWFDAIEFCNKLSQKEGLAPAYTVNGSNVSWNHSANGYRLPTEAEWEYAARGGDGSPGNFTYAGSNNVDEVAWYGGNSRGKTPPVGEKKANGLGLYDMSGNVWEWCWDWYGDYSGKVQRDPMGVSSGSGRVLRGGSWWNSHWYLRSANRDYNHPSIQDRYVGFRLVRPAQ
jgi:formylglycine-generating enzyme required for sulfatase activity